MVTKNFFTEDKLKQLWKMTEEIRIWKNEVYYNGNDTFSCYFIPASNIEVFYYAIKEFNPSGNLDVFVLEREMKEEKYPDFFGYLPSPVFAIKAIVGINVYEKYIPFVIDCLLEGRFFGKWSLKYCLEILYSFFWNFNSFDENNFFVKYKPKIEKDGVKELEVTGGFYWLPRDSREKERFFNLLRKSGQLSFTDKYWHWTSKE